MLERISNLLGEIQTLSAADEKELEALRIKYLSKKGLLNDLMADFRNVPGEQKREVGMRINELKTALQEKLAELRLNIATSEDDLSDLDLTRVAAARESMDVFSHRKPELYGALTQEL